MARKVAFIGTGGTISSIGKGPLDIMDYSSHGTMLHAEELLAKVPSAREVADLLVVKFRNIPSPAIYFPEWKELVALCARLVEEHPDLSGIVIGHGTATSRKPRISSISRSRSPCLSWWSARSVR